LYSRIIMVIKSQERKRLNYNSGISQRVSAITSERLDVFLLEFNFTQLSYLR